MVLLESLKRFIKRIRVTDVKNGLALAFEVEGHGHPCRGRWFYRSLSRLYSGHAVANACDAMRGVAANGTHCDTNCVRH